MSNIENSVITLKNFIEIFNERKTKGDIATIDVLGEEIYALEHILSEREQDKKRINELEEENHIQRSQIMTVYDNGWIPKQKVKDILQNNRNELFSITYVEPIQYKPFEMQIERINKIEKELLEDK